MKISLKLSRIILNKVVYLRNKSKFKIFQIRHIQYRNLNKMNRIEEDPKE